jgi:hypothetical protein
MKRRTIAILASAVLAGSLLASGAQARGGGGGGMGGFGGGHVGGFGGAHMGAFGGGLGVAHVDGFRTGSMAQVGHDHFARRGYGGVYNYGGYCTGYTVNTPPYNCIY